MPFLFLLLRLVVILPASAYVELLKSIRKKTLCSLLPLSECDMLCLGQKLITYNHHLVGSQTKPLFTILTIHKSTDTTWADPLTFKPLSTFSDILPSRVGFVLQKDSVVQPPSARACVCWLVGCNLPRNGLSLYMTRY